MVHPFIEKRHDPLGNFSGLADEEVVRRERHHLDIEFGRSLGTVAGARLPVRARLGRDVTE